MRAASEPSARSSPIDGLVARLQRGPAALLLRTGVVLTLVCGVLTWRERAAGAATGVNVTVNASTTLATIPSAAFGLNSAVWDANLLDSGVPGLLQQAGVNIVRYPGGSTSDGYHWQTNSITPGQGGYANPNNTFDAFMGQVQKAGTQAMVTVNYGSNAAGNGGGDPTEAANWVQYANVTKHYGVKFWEIGNEIYGNGTYGSAWETDLHPTKGPTAYANNALTYIQDMKAVDPTINVGVVLTAPGNWPDGQTPDWNSNVLSVVGSKIDFVIVHWYPQGPGSESDAGLLGATGSIAGMVSSLRNLINQYCGSNASHVQIMVTETNSVSYNPGKQTVSLVNGLFLADNYMDWLEQGVANVDWWDLHNGISTGNNNSAGLYGTLQYGDYGMVADATTSSGLTEPAAETPFPPYYGLQMLSHLGKSGDQMVATTSDQGLVAVHAVKQANGNLALLLINKDPSTSYTVNVSLNGYTPASSGTQYFYGENSNAITSSAASGLGTSFSQTLPPYSLTTVVLAPGSGGPTSTPTNGPSATNTPVPPTNTPVPPTGTPAATPSFSQVTTVSPSSIAAGSNTTIQTTFTVTSGALSNGITDIEVYDANWNKVGQQYFAGQNIAAGRSATYAYTWTAPATPGTYTVSVGTFGPNWSPNYYWVSQAGTIAVTSGTPSSTNTPVPPTNTAVAPTNTSVPPTNTSTNTPVAPTATNTPVPPTATSTNTPIPPTRTNTPQPSTTNTPIPPTATATGSLAVKDSTTVGSTTPLRGSSVKITSTVSVTSGRLSNGIVDLEVYNAANQKVGQKYFTGQNLAAGQSARYSYTWTVPNAAAQYTVMVGVFGANWTPDYLWDSSAAHMTVK